ncbi:MAG: hypothetical protein ABIQ56_00005, partial [Chitinophagaceae bacterium]
MNFKRSLTNIKTAMGRGKLLHYLFLTFLFLSIGISGIAQTACWSESINNKVRKITLGVLPADATSATTVASALVPNHLFLDGRNASFYWSVNGSGKIQRATVTGAALTDVVTGITGVGVYVQGIYLDVTNDLLYWCETATGAADKIRVINISGVLPKLASAGTDVVTGIGNVRGITKDTIANTIYFADGGLTGQGKGIYRASLAVLPVTAAAATKIALTPIALPVKPQPNTLIL